MLNNRLYNLDYLRGFAALGIMVYHYCSWALGVFHANTFLGRVGVYGVSVFYVLSGLTLYYVYYHKMKPDARDLKDFYIKRVFRIYPLLWLVTILTVITQIPSKGLPSFYTLFVNLSGLFGFIDWTEYIGTGVWSIGNELVFYLFFPVFVLFAKKSKFLFYLLSFILLAIYIAFAFYFFQPSLDAEMRKWRYMNPLNQVFLFLGGFLIGYFFKKTQVNTYVNILLLIVAFLAFILVPSKEDSVYITSGYNRIIFTLICFIICFCFYKLHFRLPNILDRLLLKLGEASYSVYLIHPVVWALFSFSNKQLHSIGYHIPPCLAISICITASLVVSYLVYLYYEKLFINIGKRVLNKQS